ncbi:MAG: TonB-dependent receptor [Vicinamibacterales bacterium]
MNQFASYKIIGFTACLSVLSTIAAYGQTGAIDGVVVDPQGSNLIGVTVTASSPALNEPVVAVTDVSGAFRVGSLPPGTYSVLISLDGFDPQRLDGIRLDNDTITVDVTLGLAPFAEQVRVVGVTPLLGSAIPRTRVPAAVFVINSNEIESRASSSIADLLNERLGTVSLEGVTTNPHQPTLRFRGFTASPLLGLPQGIAVYQNGVRVNEPFGDTVQFDLMPQFAVDRAQFSAGADPTYGLNALGGALALRLKNGFDNPGFRGEFSGGSFGRMTGTAEYGANSGPWGLYVGTTHFDETGWRVQSPSQITQAVADVAFRSGRTDAGITVTYADTNLNGNGPAPVELLAFDRSAVFTFPDITNNRLAFVQGRYNLVVNSTWSIQASAYARKLDRQTFNGDEAEFGMCNDDALPAGAPADTLCHGVDDDSDGVLDDDDDAQAEAQPLADIITGRFITRRDATGDGAFNRTDTASDGYGATLQATAHGTLGQREHILMFGVSADVADVLFGMNSEIGTMTPTRTVTGSGLFTGVYGKGGDDLFNTKLKTENQAAGLYFSDTLSLTDRSHVTVSGRFNGVHISILDKLGTSLNGEHSFARFNPAVGTVFEATDTVSLFGRYSESNRAPTAAELSCADPAEPCRVPNAFISDPPLKQPVARSIEGGLRGQWTANQRSVDWSISVYGTRIGDDILFVASPKLIGTGYFQNAGDTQRTGMDIEVSGQVARLGWYASYGFVHATFESFLQLPGDEDVNDAATKDGFLAVKPGDRMPGIPQHSVKVGILQGLTQKWDLAAETILGSSRFFLGDEGNDQPPLDGYGIVNARTTYRISDAIEFFARVDNVFDLGYETFGVLAELEVPIREVPNASIPRFVGPGAPRSAFTGIRVRF